VTGDAGKLGNRIKGLLGAKGYDRQRGEDILDYPKLKAAMNGIDVVVHCAAIPHPTNDPLPVFFNINVEGTLNVCKAAAEAGVKRVVYFSSTAYYGCNASGGFEPLYLPIHEEHPPRPRGSTSAYGTSKRMAEQCLKWYGTNGKFEAVVLRCGPANETEGQYPGIFDWKGCHDWRRTSLWANCHPDRAAEGAAKAARHGAVLQYEVFNLMDRYVSHKVDLDAFLEELFNTPGPPREGKSLFAIDKAINVLGWEPCNDK